MSSSNMLALANSFCSNRIWAICLFGSSIWVADGDRLGCAIVTLVMQETKIKHKTHLSARAMLGKRNRRQGIANKGFENLVFMACV
jgi:hypothetical protein